MKKTIVAAVEADAAFVAASYRLGPAAARAVLSGLKKRIERDQAMGGRRFLFGGTPPVVAVARDLGLFEAAFSGEEEPGRIAAYLKAAHDSVGWADQAAAVAAARAALGGREAQGSDLAGLGLIERMARKSPYPLLRHHFGLPTVADTARGISRIAVAGVVDIISIGPDQNAQESFFHPGDQDPAQDGAGSVPLRAPSDLESLYEAAQAGNHPLLRCYSGTRDLVAMAGLLRSTIRNAWGAVPLFWYSALDGRSERPLAEAIAENQAAIRWHAARGVPVEVNDPHQWSLRDAPDVVAVAVAYMRLTTPRPSACATTSPSSC
ncbi:MAG TPA: hypothetical protein VGL40_00985 [Bacillota bacterium]